MSHAPWYRRAARRTARALNGLLSYLLINLTSLLAFVFFRLFCRTRVHGREHLGDERNTLILANHRTMIDSYLIGHLATTPRGWVQPHTLPYHPAAAENFFRGRVLAWFSRRWKCIPVRRGERDFAALEQMTSALQSGQMIIFPEGTRSRSGELLPGRPGTGKLIHDTRCQCVPVYVEGMADVLPVGKRLPRIFRRVEVIFGKPVPLGDLLARPPGKETSQLVIDRVMAHIAGLRRELATIQTERRMRWAFLRRVYRFAGQPLRAMRRLFR